MLVNEMKLLLLIGLSVLLSYGVVEAGAKDADCLRAGSDGTVYNICKMPDLSKILDFDVSPLPQELVTCDQDMTKCETPCERKMKEVMREVDEILKFNHESLNSRKPGEARICFNLSPILYQWWSNVMKECVQ